MSYLIDPYTVRASGTVYYVNGTTGSSGNTGLLPNTPKATIAQAVAAASAGDTIVVGAGTYTETGLDVNKNYLKIRFEHGVTLDPASGTALTVSASGCRLDCPGGALKITPAQDATGVNVTSAGTFTYLSDLRVDCDGGAVGTSADLGFDIEGGGTQLTNCRCSAPDIAAFKIQGNKVRLLDCCTGGKSGYSSIGFWVTNSCGQARIKTCGSQGHESAGYQVDTGCTAGVIEDSYSGGGDGKWTDADNAFVWSDFQYERVKYKTSTFTATGGVGGAGTNYNLFKIIGSVRVFHIFGHVTTVLPATSTVPNLELYSTNASIDITDAAGGPDITGACVGATLKRLEPANEPLVYGNPDGTPAVTESANYRDPHVPIVLTKDDSADTYIQVVLTAAMASGAMHWHVEWEPVTDDGWVEPA